MSGLCGIVHWDGAPVEADALQPMIDAGAHRGPDGVGTWRRGGVGLAHLALHVTPESAREAQPLADAEADLALVADARIDNRDALTRALRGVLRTGAPTDADLILAAYRRWGVDCAAHLIGDFAFAVWDAGERRLFAARDPMAMRAFYYRIEPNRFLFGSEIKQILAAPDVPARFYEPGVAAYLAGQFHPLDWTFYEGIQQLEPAHALVAEADGTHRTWRYWDINPDKRIRYDDERDYVEHFRTLFAEAMRCRLRSTKPVGLFLSGGLDSGSVASMAGHLKETEGIGSPGFRTYSWAFPTLTQCDERPVSDRIVERYDLPATYVDAEAVNLIGPPDGVPDRDEPFMGVYQALLAEGLRQAREEGIGRMLSGHRGDLLAGDWVFDYIGLLQRGRWATLWRALQAHEEKLGVPVRRAVRHYLYKPMKEALWPRDRWPALREPLRRAWRGMRGLPEPSPYPPWVADEIEARITRPARPDHRPDGLGGWARRRRYETIMTPMHMRTAMWSQRLCMRHHIEFADPWTDRRLVRFAMAVPQRVLSRQGENKRIIRQAMHGIMPEQARRSAGKVDPSPLYERALKVHHAGFIRDILSRSKLEQYEFINRRAVHEYVQAYDQGEVEDHRFWYTLTAEMWMREFF